MFWSFSVSANSWHLFDFLLVVNLGIQCRLILSNKHKSVVPLNPIVSLVLNLFFWSTYNFRAPTAQQWGVGRLMRRMCSKEKESMPNNTSWDRFSPKSGHLMDMHLNCRYCWHCRPQIWIKEASLQLRQELGWKHRHVSLWLCCLPWVCPTIYVDHFSGCSLKKLVCMDVNIISSMSITIVGSLASKLELTSTSEHA